MLLEIKNLSLRIIKNNRLLIDNLSFSVNNKDKIAIIGEEGNGKSTLLRCLANDLSVSLYAEKEGTIKTHGARIGYLPQKACDGFENCKVIDFFAKQSINDEINYDFYMNYNKIIKYFELFQLDINMLEDDRKIKYLSGGEKVKISLIKILINSPDVLLLDEPTNDIDIYCIEWLEKFIKQTNLPVIYVSHDEELLSKTANAILHIEQIKRKTLSKCTFVHMRYDDYILNRIKSIEKQNQIAKFERNEFELKKKRWNEIFNKVHSDLNSVSRQDPHGATLLAKKMKSVKAQEKKLDKEKENLTEYSDFEESIYLNFGTNKLDKSNIICNVNYKNLQINNKLIINNINLLIKGNEKIAIIGKNGCGKTTLLHKILNDISINKKLKVGFMPQNYDMFLNDYEYVLDYLHEYTQNKDQLTQVITYLGSLKFTEDEIFGKISELSGGSKAKLYLAKIMADECNVLVLDEPTRNLSPLSNPVIRSALGKYSGAIISVSHDRKFLNEVPDKIYELFTTGLIDCSNKFKNI